MEISYRLGHPRWNEQEGERIPTLELYISEIDEVYYIDLKELAEALKPFLEIPTNTHD